MIVSWQRRPWPESRPGPRVGLVAALLSVALATAAVYVLKHVAPVVSLSVVYLPAVLFVSAYWGMRLGLTTSLLSAAAFNFFHIPPTGRFTISDSRNWVALLAFAVVAVVVSTMAEQARNRALEAERRRREADLAAALARELLAGAQIRVALGATARRVAEALGLPSAAIEPGTAQPTDRRQALALRDAGGEQVATLLVPGNIDPETEQRLRTHVVPVLAALVSIATHRDQLQAEAVETAALRRSDDVKTALLRAVSHDLRSPLTAIVAAGHALGAGSLTSDERAELSTAVVEEGTRLAALVDKLLDLSRLQAGRAEPHRDWVSLEEVLLTTKEALGGEADDVRVSIGPDVPDVRADAAQLERALANLLENARRYSHGLPVSVLVRRTGARVVIRVVDHGPGIAPAERARIFEPFYRGAHSAFTGSGLGLAIAKGFVEANGGTIAVESLPGQGTTFVISLPLQRQPAQAVPA